MISLCAAFPHVLPPLVAAFLGSFSWTIALEAIGLSFLIGSLFTAFYTAATLALSSLTRRKSYAAAGVFALTFGLTIPAEILAGPPFYNPAVLYASPWENYLAVPRAAFGATGAPIVWRWSLAILLPATSIAALSIYLRMKFVEVVSG